MEVLSYNLNIEEVVPFDLNSFDPNAVYLWVLHADKIPPHIGISSEGKYFSLKSNGKDEEVEIASVLSIIDRKGIKTLLFELKSDLSAKMIEDGFSIYDKTHINHVTCLNPLKDLFNYPDARKLTELLAELNADELIESVTGVNIDGNFKGIQDYKTEDIHNRLRKLEND